MSNITESPLVNKLLGDKRYIEDEGESNAPVTRERHYKKMRYAVKQYGRMISRFGESIYERAAEYNLEHSKSPAVWEPEAYIARRLHSMHRMDAELLSEGDYRRLVEVVNKALRYMAVKWTDWEDMLAILKLYLLRAEVAADRAAAASQESEEAEEAVAIADLRHAAAVLKHYAGDPEIMIMYFVDGKNGQEDLLLRMLWLQQKLLGKAVKNPVNTPVVGGINGRADVYQAIEAIRVHDNLYELTLLEDKRQQQSKEHWQTGGNIQMTEKATLTNDPNTGRCWKAIEAIEEGEPIMFERPQVVVLFEEQFTCYCDHCHRKLVTFWPCCECTELTYCSASCAQAAFEHYHQAECGIYGFIMNEGNYNAALAYRHYATFGVPLATQCEEEVAQIEKTSKQETAEGNDQQPMVDFFACEAIRSKPYSQLDKTERKVLCKALTGQLSHRGHHLPVNEIYQTVRAITLVECLFYKGIVGRELFLDSKQYSALLEHMAMSIMRTVTNAFSWDQTVEDDEEGEKARVGCATSLQASLFNHCCDPNVAWTITEGVLHMEALRPIKVGEELTISYGPRPHSALYSRQLRLRRDYIFFCRCELCRFEASASVFTLACQAPPNSQSRGAGGGALCPGPLVLSPHRSCLLCAYQPSEARCQRVAATGAAASAHMMRLFRGLYHLEESQWTASAVITIAATRSACILQAMGIWRKEVTETDEMAHSSSDLFQEDDSLVASVSKQQITQLEKQFDICSKAFYGGSLHMLEKCTMLLKVYSDSKLYHRGFRLLEPLSHCLEAIIPSRIDANQENVPIMLDFAVNFYEQLASNHIDIHLSDSFWELATLRQQLNSTLLQILQYDRLHRGDFFPLSYQRGEDASDFDASERHFRQMLDDCSRRRECNEAVMA